MIFLLIGLVVVSAFFSGSETGMMSINRYRLRHLERKGNKSAHRVVKLLSRPDRILGVILIGNTFANILASSIATIIAVRYFGDLGVILSTIALTLVVLIFAETAPKTLAALHPERVAFSSAAVLSVLLKVFYPLVWFVNGIANGFLRLFKVSVKHHKVEPLSVDELRTLVNEATGKIARNYQQMLLRILDLERVTVEDVMVPRSEIFGIDLEQPWEKIQSAIIHSKHAYLPLYRENINQVIGILNLRKVLASLQNESLSLESIQQYADKPYYVPEGAHASKQLLYFQQLHKTIGLVVDEYGDIQGLITLQDILEEIVGEFSVDLEEVSRVRKHSKDGSYIVSGNINVRELNRIAHWDLPTDGPKTLSGIVIEYLEMIPTIGVSVKINGYPIEVIAAHGNTVKQLRVWPRQQGRT